MCHPLRKAVALGWARYTNEGDRRLRKTSGDSLHSERNSRLNRTGEKVPGK